MISFAVFLRFGPASAVESVGARLARNSGVDYRHRGDPYKNEIEVKIH